MSKRLVFLGDSITGWSDLSKYLKFSHIVELMLEARLGEGQVQVFNRGIGGNTTAQVLERLEREVLVERPDAVVLLIGGNDAGTGMARDVTATNLDLILSRLCQARTKVLVLQYHLLVNPLHPETAWKHLVTNNDLIAAAAEAHQCPLLHMGPIMLEALAQYDLEQLVSAEDGVHINPGGELVFARAVFAHLVELGWSEAVPVV